MLHVYPTSFFIPFDYPFLELIFEIRLSFVVSSVSLSLSHWYPGSGVVLDCIDS